jgi:GxxExxY protein
VTEILYKELSYAIIGAAMEVHRVLGPGFLEAVYQKALAHELTLRGTYFEQFKRLPVTYKEVLVGEYEADFVVEDKIILEIKAISRYTLNTRLKPSTTWLPLACAWRSCSTLEPNPSNTSG